MPSQNEADYKTVYKNLIAKYLDISPENVFLFWKGRVALYSILKAAGIRKDDEVIIPALTCVVVPNAIIYLGAKPVYVDIDPETYTIDVSKIEKNITSKTRAILAQNTFGLSSDLDPIMETGEKHNIFVIEDCAQGVGGTYKQKPNGTISDASFFSTQWQKPFSTGVGGFAITKHSEIVKNLKTIEDEAAKPSILERKALEYLFALYEKFMNSESYWLLITLYRYLSSRNLILGSSQGNELALPIMPSKFLKACSTFQAKKGNQKLQQIDESINYRKKVARTYKNILESLGIKTPDEPAYASHSYLRFPLLVKDRAAFFAEAKKSKVEIGDWFLSPIHPITRNFTAWNYRLGENPIAEKISNHIVNLPTHTGIDENYISRVREFLIKNRNNIFDRLPPM